MTTTEEIAAPPAEVPVPKYKVGDVIWRASTTIEKGQHPCPDCLGSTEWHCTTPGGTELTVPCQRCSSGWSSNDIPSLHFSEHKPHAYPMTIRSIKIRVMNDRTGWRASPVTYYDSDGCCGTSVDEASVIETKEQAETVAQIMAAEKNAVAAATPERLVQKRLSALRFRDAALQAAKDGVWDAWVAYRFLREELEGIVAEDNNDSAHEKIDTLREALEFEKRYRAVGREFINALNAVMEKAMAEFPLEMFEGVPAPLLSPAAPTREAAK